MLLLLGACSDKDAQDCAAGFLPDAQGRCNPVAEGTDSGGPPASNDEPDPETDTGEDTDSPVDDGLFEMGPVLACDSPAATVSYSEVGIEWGFAPPEIWKGEHAENGSVAVADFDLDGDLDVVTGFDGQPPLLYTRDGDGGFYHGRGGMPGTRTTWV